MGKLNLNDNLFIGTQELKAFQDNTLQFKKILGYLTKTYGFVDLKDISRVSEGNDDCWKVQSAGNGAFVINESYAFAYPYNLIAWNNEKRIVKIPSSFYNKAFWVKIKYATDSFEKGTLTIDASGNISGSGTEFKERLRGEPNFASVIELFYYNSTSNSWISSGQYSVESVSTNTSCVVNVRGQSPDPTVSYLYKVVGTFPIGTVITTDMKFPFVYDSCEVELIEESTEGQAPNEAVMMVSNEEFYIARIVCSAGGGISSITDMKYYFENTELFDPKYSKWWSLK